MLKVICYRCWEELESLHRAWNRVLQESASDTVFLTWPWVRAWWKNYSGHKALFVLAASDGNELVGVAPFCCESVRRYGRSWRRLRLVGDGSHDSDYLDMFALRGRECEAVTAFGEYLSANLRSWDWMELAGPAQTSPMVAAISEYAREKKWHCNSGLIPCTTLPLPASWDQYLRGLEPRFRTKVRGSLTILRDFMKTEPRECGSNEQADRWLPVLFDLHTRRWAMRETRGVFAVPQRRSFYADLSRAAIEQGWLAFHRLDWGERPLAMQYGLVYGNRFYLLQEGYDPDFADLRPGVALRAWLMRHWIEASLAEYDFLAGVSDYKFDWGASGKCSQRVVISAHPLSKLVASDIPRLELVARERVSRVLPTWLHAWRQRVRLSRRRALFASESGKFRLRRGPAVRTRQLLSATYSSTPIGRWGKSIASQYVWAPRSGANFLLHRRSQPVCQIFQYHRVNDDRDPFFAALPSATFRKQMQYLVRNFPLMTLDQLAGGEFPKGEPYSVVVTFDDGYRDNFVCAYPILRELQIPATVFLTTGYVDSGELPWYDRVRLAFRLTTRSKLSISGIPGGHCDLSGASHRACSAEQVLAWLRAMPESESKAALGELFRLLGVPADLNLPNQMLRWDEVRKMANSGVTFGAHTVNHRVLSKISETEMRREILESKRAIENRLQKPASHFAYPFGQPFDFTAQAKAVVKDSGFKTAVTTMWGLNEPSADPYELRRFTPWGSAIEDFRLSLDWYRFCKLPALGASTGRAPFSKGMS